MKISYVGDLLNYGEFLSTFGTGLLLILLDLNNIDEINAFTPIRNLKIEDFDPPNKIKIHETYKYNSYSIFVKLMKNLTHYDSDFIIFSLIPTSFGTNSISNLEGLLTPQFLSLLRKKRDRIKVIYHNSTFTNDVRKLGYTSLYDNIRAKVLSNIEKAMFKHTQVYVTLMMFVERIKQKTGIRVNYLDTSGIEAIPTLYLNGLLNQEYVKLPRNDIPLVLLHGYWGPQKNLELALKVLKRLKEQQYKFDVLITGGINPHFPKYEKEFYDLLKSYGFINKYKGKVLEREIYRVFTQADLILLPYNTPGGKSGVLDQAIFFEVPVVSVDFPEYREQAKGYEKIVFCSKDEFEQCVKNALENLEKSKYINIKKKVNTIRDNIAKLLG